jgi:hypothetical protein
MVDCHTFIVAALSSQLAAEGHVIWRVVAEISPKRNALALAGVLLSSAGWAGFEQRRQVQASGMIALPDL